MTTAIPSGSKAPGKYGGPSDIQNGWRRLAGGAEIAAQTLIDVAENSENDAARVAAAQAILNRIGLQTNQDVTVRVVPQEFDPALNSGSDNAVTPSQIIEQRLDKLAAAQSADDEIVEAELVD